MSRGLRIELGGHCQGGLYACPIWVEPQSGFWLGSSPSVWVQVPICVARFQNHELLNWVKLQTKDWESARTPATCHSNKLYLPYASNSN